MCLANTFVCAGGAYNKMEGAFLLCLTTVDTMFPKCVQGFKWVYGNR